MQQVIRPDLEVRDILPAHLWPAFRMRLLSAIAQANRETKEKYPLFERWAIYEGYRSQERQTYLYDQGRQGTPLYHSGPHVTNDPIAHFHGIGLAADVVWYDADEEPHWDGTLNLWNILGHGARTFGLTWGGNWVSFPDKPHIQGPVEWARAARAWTEERLQIQNAGHSVSSK